jgi:predicted nuclease of predicted toxin-antitoxin system
MRFLVDECTGSAVARWLQQQGYEVFSVYDQARGMDDDVVIRKAFDENWILITNDKDFGEKVHRFRVSHHGIVLLRLADERAVVKVEVIERLLKTHANQLADRYVVVTESSIRFSGKE